MAHWRDTYKPARFFMLDARAGVPMLLTLLHIQVWTLVLSSSIVAIFWFLERRGMTLPSAFRALRAWAIGDARPPLPFHKIRGRIDYERRFDENRQRITAPSASSKSTMVSGAKGKAVK